MIFSIVIVSITVLSIVVTSIVKPSFHIKNMNINLYWLIALLGALVLLLSGYLSFNEFFNGLTSNPNMNPIQILILFLSMSMISIFLDELGFFEHIASWVLKHTKSKQITIFTALYFLIAILTMFTSNDIIILTLTPFIIFFCKNAKISPLPYLVAEFTCANTWSMMFVIGNPTNIYLSQTYAITFIDYFLVMAIPTLLAGTVEFALLLLIFKKKLSTPIEHHEELLPTEDRFLTIYGLIILLGCTVMLIISSYVSIPMYLIALCSLAILTIGALIYYLVTKQKPKEIFRTYLRAPYELIPFILSMFVLVLALDKYEVTKAIGEFFGSENTVWIYGYSSFLSANIFNNIPMSVIFSSILSGLSDKALIGGVYASIIGSNIGAFLTPMGALAGIMWMGILKKHEVKYRFIDFMKYGLVISLPVITIALIFLGLCLN